MNLWSRSSVSIMSWSTDILLFLTLASVYIRAQEKLHTLSPRNMVREYVVTRCRKTFHCLDEYWNSIAYSRLLFNGNKTSHLSFSPASCSLDMCPVSTLPMQYSSTFTSYVVHGAGANELQDYSLS